MEQVSYVKILIIIAKSLNYLEYVIFVEYCCSKFIEKPTRKNYKTTMAQID